MITPDTFDNSRKFIFSNWTDEDFIGIWDGQPYLIAKGETKEYQMSLAYHFTKHLVDRELIKANKANLMGVPEERAPLEDKTMAELIAGQDSPALATLKEQIRAELQEAEGQKEVVVETEELKESEEFADIKQEEVKADEPGAPAVPPKTTKVVSKK